MFKSAAIMSVTAYSRTRARAISSCIMQHRRRFGLAHGVHRNNEVAPRRARLVLRWMTVRRYAALACNQPRRLTESVYCQRYGKSVRV